MERRRLRVEVREERGSEYIDITMSRFVVGW